MHLEKESVQRVVDGEPIPAGASEHLATCADCRAAVDRARDAASRIDRLLGLLDHEKTRLRPPFRFGRRPGRTGPLLRWAAGIALVAAGAGTAYAWPGSPLPEWIDRLGGGDRGPSREAGWQAEPLSGGLAIDPGDSVTVHVPEDHGGTVHIRLTDAESLVVRADPDRVAFTAARHDIRIQTRDPEAGIVVDVPETARLVVVFVGDEVVFRKSGDDVRTRGTRTDDAIRVEPAEATPSVTNPALRGLSP